jgi:hypothetical protein
MNYFPQIDRWHMPLNTLGKSLQEMALDGALGNEGISLWLGDKNEHGDATVSHEVHLRGPGIVKSPANIQIAPDLMRKVHEVARQLELTLVGQIHSHGAEYGVSLSFVDRRYGISVPYYLSVVAPDYAMRPKTTIEDCGVHVFMPGVGYVGLTTEQIRKCIFIESERPIEILTIGNDRA